MTGSTTGRAAPDPADLADAGRVADHLGAINRMLRSTIVARAQRLPVPLTRPQVLALQILAEDESGAGTGLSLSELSNRMSLAHSTVSGIVTRLERTGLLRRSTCTDDRRCVRIRLTDPVRGWVHRELPALWQQPLATALGRLTREEREALVAGLALLQRLLEADAAQTSHQR